MANTPTPFSDEPITVPTPLPHHGSDIRWDRRMQDMCALSGHEWRLVRDGIVGQECRCCGARRLLSHADG